MVAAAASTAAAAEEGVHGEGVQGEGVGGDGGEAPPWWKGKTEQPLLDFPQERRRPPFIAASCRGTGAPPAEPFGALAAYAVSQMQGWGSGYPNAAVQQWAYVRSKRCAGTPGEALLHLTARGRGFCAHLRREHRSQKAMVSVDLVSGRAWHRCWDASCRAADGTAARHELPQPPAAAVPSLEELLDFERARGLSGPARAEQDTGGGGGPRHETLPCGGDDGPG